MLPFPAADPFEQMVLRFKALGHPVRLAVLRRVVEGPEGGTPAGDLQGHLGIPASTLSHHLACLADADLVEVAREGTSLRYRANFLTLRALTDYLWKDCCSGGAHAPAQPVSCCSRKGRRTSRT